MKNTLKILGIIALAAIIGFTMIGCKKNTSASSAPTATTAPAPAAGGAAATGFLAEYEAFVNEASDVMQKMLSGDLTAATQASALGTKAEEMVNRWQNLTAEELTPAQVQKFEELSDKLTKSLGL